MGVKINVCKESRTGSVLLVSVRWTESCERSIAKATERRGGGDEVTLDLLQEALRQVKEPWRVLWRIGCLIHDVAAAL